MEVNNESIKYKLGFFMSGMRSQQPPAARGSITQGTPVRETAMGRGMMHQDQGAPRGQGLFSVTSSG